MTLTCSTADPISPVCRAGVGRRMFRRPLQRLVMVLGILLTAGVCLAGYPPQPILLGPSNGASNLDPNNFTFYWSIPNNFYVPYMLYRVKGTSWVDGMPGYAVNTGSFTTNLQPYTTYEWWVASVDVFASNNFSTDWFTWSEVHTFTTGNPAGKTTFCTPFTVDVQSCTVSATCSGTKTRTCSADGSTWNAFSSCVPNSSCQGQTGGVPLATSFQFPTQSQGFGQENPDRSVSCQPHDTHTGLDVSAAAGTPVRAAADGIVRYAGTQGDCTSGWGSLVIVESKLSDGRLICIIYGHISPSVSTDHILQNGEIVGYVQHFSCWGDHVHFGVYEGPYNEITCGPTSCLARGYLCPSDFPGKYVDPNKFVTCGSH
jgi:hypothetical protein